MYCPAPYIHKAAVVEESNGDSFLETMKGYNDRVRQYGSEATTASNGSRKRRYQQSLGMITSALLGAAGGVVAGAFLGGAKGAKIGAPLGLAAGIGANYIGRAAGQMAPARSKKEQLAYHDSRDGVMKELLIPGYAGYQRGRDQKHVQETVNKEYANKRVV